MTMPMEYVLASKEFEAFMADFMEMADLPTHHRAYHSIRAVLHVFRAHLSTADALIFAGELPPILRAIYVEDWIPVDNPLPFPGREALLGEVKSVRPDHNLAPDTVITDAARALRRHIDVNSFERMLAGLPFGAATFWSGN